MLSTRSSALPGRVTVGVDGGLGHGCAPACGRGVVGWSYCTCDVGAEGGVSAPGREQWEVEVNIWMGSG